MPPRLVGSPRRAGFVQLHQAVPLVERQHVIIEELRLSSPRTTPARQLAARAGVSIRTIERDIDRLCDSGVPIERRRGAMGGYALAARPVAEAVRLTAAEVATLIASLSALGPYTTATGASAMRKLIDALADPAGAGTA